MARSRSTTSNAATVSASRLRTASSLLSVALLVGCAAPGPEALLRPRPTVLPPDGAALNYLHVPFRWEAADSATGYRVQVVEDDGRPDPFEQATPVVDVAVDWSEPRTVVTSGLEFGGAYAWRVSASTTEEHAWSPTRRFSTRPLPEQIPEFVVSRGPSTAAMEPGLTLFSQGGFVAVDTEGRPVWFLQVGFGHDIRMLSNGHVSYISKGLSGEEPGRAYEATLDGRIVWSSPADPTLDVHHEVSPMPNGNFLAVVREQREVLRDGAAQPWAGDRVVEFDRRSGEVVWSWSSFDHYSTLDLDEDEMWKPDRQGGYDWTHANGAVYDAATDSVYFCVRHLSRVTRIDYATGEVLFNMGFDTPSGDADFGHDLFSFPHSPQILANGHLMLFDNGNRREVPPSPRFSRAIELAFLGGDPPSGTAIVWEYRLPEYAPSGGDADRLPGGNTLIASAEDPESRADGTGERAEPDPELEKLRGLGYLGSAGARRSGGSRPPSRVYEIDPAGERVWTLEVTDPLQNVYRAERVPRLIVDTPGDADGDWDLDVVDARALEACFTGPGARALGFPCTLSDLDRDGDVDCADREAFERDWTQASPPPPLPPCQP